VAFAVALAAVGGEGRAVRRLFGGRYRCSMAQNLNRHRVFRFLARSGHVGTLELIGDRLVLDNPELGARRVVSQGPRAKQAFSDLSRELVRSGEVIEIPARTSVEA